MLLWAFQIRPKTHAKLLATMPAHMHAHASIHASLELRMALSYYARCLCGRRTRVRMLVARQSILSNISEPYRDQCRNILPYTGTVAGVAKHLDNILTHLIKVLIALMKMEI